MAASPPIDRRTHKVTQALAAYASGKRVHLPVVRAADARAITAELHRAIDQEARKRERGVASIGATLACSAGCSACCSIAVLTQEPEALRIAAWLDEPAQAQARAGFLERSPAWHEAMGAAAAEVSSLHALGRLEQAERAYFQLRERQVPCAFLDESRCSVYPVRPAVCRNTHALGTADACQPNAERGPEILGFASMDDLMEQVPVLLEQVQQALPDAADRPPEAVCTSVHRLLTSPTPEPPLPSRNAACPCGSGEKFKHCCDF